MPSSKAFVNPIGPPHHENLLRQVNNTFDDKTVFIFWAAEVKEMYHKQIFERQYQLLDESVSISFEDMDNLA